MFLVGQRVRFSGRPGAAGARSTVRPGEVWEGTVIAVEGERVKIQVDRLNGMRTEGTKEVCVPEIDWDPGQGLHGDAS